MMIAFQILYLLTLFIIFDKNPEQKQGERKGYFIARVSTAEQVRNGDSLTTQKEWKDECCEKHGIHIKEELVKEHSGYDFLNNFHDKILNDVIDHKITHIIVYKFDRFSRNLSSACRLIDELRKYKIKIVTHSSTYDLNNNNDRFWVYLKLLFAENNYFDITERGFEGMVSKLKKGIYYLNGAPFGYEKVDFLLRRKDEYVIIVNDLFTFFIECRNYQETARYINEKYSSMIDKKVTSRKIKKIIEDEIYIGYFSIKGFRIGSGEENKPRDNLVMIDTDLFDRAKHIVLKIGKKYRHNNPNKVEQIKPVIDKNGYDTVRSIIDNIRIVCPECKSINIGSDGGETINGTYYQKFRCKRKKCGHRFRFPTAKQLKGFKSLNSKRCPHCGTADIFDVKESNLNNHIQCTCKNCGFIFHAHKDSMKYNKQKNEKCKKKKKSKPAKKKKSGNNAMLFPS